MINQKPYAKKFYKVTTTDYHQTSLRLCELTVIHDERVEIPPEITENSRCTVQLNYFRTRAAALAFRDKQLARRTIQEVQAW